MIMLWQNSPMEPQLMHIVKRLIPYGFLCLLSACGGNLEKLQEAKPTGGDFSSALAAEYLGFSESEKEMGHAYHSNYFAQKGLQALDGNDVFPEKIEPELPAADRNELTDGRGQLLALLNDEMKHVSPARLARAQLLFDCWQHQLVTRTGEKVAPCAAEFVTTLQEVQALADSFLTGDETVRTISFARHDAKISQQAQRTLDKAVAQAKAFTRYKFRVDGNIDAFAKGTASYNLTNQRMSAVRDALIARGVKGDDVEVLRDTEGTHLDPVVLSSDAPRKPRSVDIILRTYSAGETAQ
jgi:outer membrane protein OmpA-like peptidoglycan-associated protein